MGRAQINRAEMNRLLYSQAGPVVKHITTVCRSVRSEAVRRAPRDTGKLATSLDFTVNVYGTKVVGRVGTSLDYAAYVHDGTGIYGPRKRPITPVSAKVLRFRPGIMVGPLPRGKRGPSPERRGAWVFAKSVKGMPARPFLLEALIARSPYPVQIIGAHGRPRS